MIKIELGGFENDVEIRGVGQFFRSVKGSPWSIDLKLSPRQRRNYFSTSIASLAVRGRIINSRERKDKEGLGKELRIADTTNWKIKTIKDFPAFRYEKINNSEQLCFVFTFGGTTYYLPQFELARVLFFHGSYLSQTALESECLRGEFSVEVDHDNNAIINVMDSSGFSLAYFNEPTTRNYLSWILLDDDARRSFESISKYQRMDGVDWKGYRRWNFQFDPPPLSNVKLKVGGQYSKEDEAFFVFRIKEIRGLVPPPYRTISMHHPKFERAIPGQGTAVRPAGGEPDTPVTVYDDVESNADTEAMLLEDDPVIVEFTHPLYVSKITTKEKKRPIGTSSDESSNGPTVVSTEEGVHGQGLPAADLDSLEDETDYGEIFESKFSCFKKMVDMLVYEYGCVFISGNATKLPRVGKSKKHLLSTGDANRLIIDVKLRIGPKTVHLLEVDTSDAEQSLSTQLIVTKNEMTWERDFERLKAELVRSSLRWPTKMLKQLFHDGRRQGVPHPQSPANNKGVLPPDSIAGWAFRVRGWMEML